jgi:hypothetical protein
MMRLQASRQTSLKETPNMTRIRLLSVAALLVVTLEPAIAAQAEANQAEPYFIGAWYFTAWSSANDDVQPRASKATYGRRDPWGGVRDYALGHDRWGLQADYSSREPLLGFYDLMDQEIMDDHIRMAASRGLAYFAFYWYWDADRDQESTASIPMHKYLSSSYKRSIRFLLAPIVLGKAHMTVEMWQRSVVPYFVRRYIADPAYLTTSDGRPFIIDFKTNFATEAEHRAGLLILRQAVRNKTGRDPVILEPAQERNTWKDLVHQKRVLGPDGFACFQFPPFRPHEPYVETTSRSVTVIRSQDQPFYIPSASTGFDARPWFKVGWGFQDPGPMERPYNVNATPELFENHLRSLRDYMDGHPRQTDRMLTIYAWNEWGEGGIIEPSFVRGYQYLDIVQRTFRLHGRSTEPALSPHRATFISQKVPEIIPPQKSAKVAITFLNRGKTAWSGGFALLYTHFRDGRTGVEQSPWGVERVTLNPGEEVSPGQTKTFEFSITAPANMNSADFEWRLADDHGQRFGDFSPNVPVAIHER